MLERASAIDGETILPLADAKKHLRITHSREDDLIRSWRDTAIDYVERQAACSLVPTEWIWTGSLLPGNGLDLPIGPVTEVGTVTYVGSDGEPATYAGARILRGRLYPAHLETWPTTYGEVTVEFTAGVDAPAARPKLLSAVRILMGHLEKNRGDLDGIPAGVRRLVSTPVRI